MADSFSYPSLGAMFLTHARRYGSKVLHRYFADGCWHALTWQEALGRIREIALGWVSPGIECGDRVVLFSANRVDWLLADWAHICIGALTVPIYASNISSQINHIVGHTDPALMEAYAGEPQRRAKILRATEEHAEVLLKQFCHDAVQHLPSPRIRHHVRKGDPFENILDGAEDFLTDLIVLATHGRTGLKRLVIGNVAEKIVRHAPCPVLSVKPKSAAWQRHETPRGRS